MLKRTISFVTHPLFLSLFVLVTVLLWLAPQIWGAPALIIGSGSSMEPTMSGYNILLVIPEQPSEVETGGAGSDGEIVVFRTPVSDKFTVHRASMYVSKGEDWHQDALPRYIPRSDGDCEWYIDTCPAVSSGLITKGDNNSYYDQAIKTQDEGVVTPVGKERLLGVVVAHFPIPNLVGKYRHFLFVTYLFLALVTRGALLE